MSSPTSSLTSEKDFKDPYYYILIAVGWLNGGALAFTLWAQTPWFPWK